MSKYDPALAPDFRDCIASLNAHRVRFVLVGGYALGWHGVIRATGDIDFLYRQTTANVRRLCAALREFGAPEHLIDPPFLLSPNAVTQIGLPPLRIDLLAAISGVSFAEVDAGAHDVEVDGQRLRIIGINELRRNKQAAGRGKDKQDLRGLASANPQHEAGVNRSRQTRAARDAGKPARSGRKRP
ncbi:MAG TPA: nucleotidyl transferase AbiEii/AbiGii toxin family protein [Gemmatimonadaceae bacterium]